MNRPRKIEPGPGQESVWDYPRPPRLEPVHGRVTIEFNGQVIVDTTRAMRVLETSHPPTVYVPPEDVKGDFVKAAGGASMCEWKGRAGYVDVAVDGKRVEHAAWFYADPTPAFRDIKDYLSFYPSKMDRCTLDGETVTAQEGDFYGGWITSKVVGPFKGAGGTWGW